MASLRAVRKIREDVRWHAWFASRPPVVQAVARIYPPGAAFDTEAGPLYVIAYGETKKPGEVLLELTHVDPFEDYDEAVRTRAPTHWECLGLAQPGLSNPEPAP